MSLSGQNMILGYNAPVLDPTLIGKPFVWGYILFGNKTGLSWYWCSKMILGLLAAFEMCRILTKDDMLSAFGSVLIIYSPAIQWWFCPHMYDVFFWAMAVFAVGYHFFTADKLRWKILTTILAVSVLVGFTCALFPSLQISAGLVVLALFITCLLCDRDRISFSSFSVNPICRGISVVTDQPFVQEAVTKNEEDPGIWITENLAWEQNLLIANGIRDINAVNYYPDMEKWSRIDPTGASLPFYNRYAHIFFHLTNDETSYSNPSPDNVSVQINASALPVLNVKYILTIDDLNEVLDNAYISYEIVYNANGYLIYKLEY